jgi:hypothetical protein
VHPAADITLPDSCPTCVFAAATFQAEPAPEAEVGTVPRKLGEAEVPPPPATPTARPADEGAPAASPEIKSVAAPTPIPTPAPPTTKPVEPVTPTFPAAEVRSALRSLASSVVANRA